MRVLFTSTQITEAVENLTGIKEDNFFDLDGYENLQIDYYFDDEEVVGVFMVSAEDIYNIANLVKNNKN